MKTTSLKLIFVIGTLLAGLTIFLLPGAKAEQSELSATEPWHGEDGTICSFSADSERFINCVEFEHYPVTGQSRAALLRSMYENGPKEGNGITVSRLEWGADIGGDCMLGVFSVVTLPQHQDQSNFSAEFLEYWNATLAALRMHELNHHDIAVTEAWAEFRTGCAEVENLADRIDALNEEYDRETNHGASEGARF